MLPVIQSELEPGRGNCMAACVASILELPITEVPNFRLATEPFQAMQEWLSLRGLCATRFPPDFDIVKSGEQIFCILTGKSPRRNVGHAVVGIAKENEFIMVHDPHPDGTGIDGDLQSVIFIKSLGQK